MDVGASDEDEAVEIEVEVTAEDGEDNDEEDEDEDEDIWSKPVPPLMGVGAGCTPKLGVNRRLTFGAGLAILWVSTKCRIKWEFLV